MGSCARRGPWTVPPHLEVHVRMGNVELDLREAVLGDDTTIEIKNVMGNVEIIVPSSGILVDTAIDSSMGNVEDNRPEGTREPGAKRLRLIGRVKLGNVEII